jgi:uncharacterized protein (TIRG00374 family)
MRVGLLKLALFWLGLLVSALATYLAVRDVNFAATWDALRHCNYWWLGPAVATLALSIFVRAIRWRALFGPERRPGLGPITKSMLVGLLFNNVLPARAGELARIVALKSYAGTSRAEATATVVVERLFDVVTLLALLFVFVPWLPHVSWLRAAAVVALVAVVATAMLIALAIYLTRRPAGLVGLFAKLPFLNYRTALRLTTSVVRGLAAIRRPGQATVVFGWTILSWFVLGLSFWFLMLGFDLDLSPLAGLLVVIATGLAFVVPAAPGAVGVFEAAGLAATSAYGIANSRALAYVLVLHAINVVPLVFAGLAVLATGRGRQRLRPRFSISTRQ